MAQTSRRGNSQSQPDFLVNVHQIQRNGGTFTTTAHDDSESSGAVQKNKIGSISLAAKSNAPKRIGNGS